MPRRTIGPGGMALVIRVVGDDTTIVGLEEIAARATNLDPVWPAVFALMEEIESEQYGSQGARGGAPWPDLQQSTLWRKFQAGESLAVMRATDATFQALSGPGPASIRNIVGGHTIEFGADLDQFRIHQDWNPTSNYPMRQPVNFTEPDATAFADMIMSYIVGTADRHGRVSRRYPKGTPGGLGGRFVS